MSTTVEDFLAHYGVKGMKWGVRTQGRSSGPSEVTVTQKGRKLKTSGGKGQQATAEARTAAAARRKAKASGTHSLSNEELQAAIRRMNLEQQFNNLSAGNRSAGRKFIGKLLGQQGSALASDVASNETRKIGEAIKKKRNE